MLVDSCVTPTDDTPETTVNAVQPDDWEGENPRRISPDQEPVSRFQPFGGSS